METIEQIKLVPSVGQSFGQGWNVMKKYFLILFLAVLVIGLVSAPAQIFKWNIDPHHHGDWNFHFPDLGFIALTMFTVIAGLIALAYALLVIPIFRYGGKIMFLQAVRDIRPDFNLLVSGFKENYLGIVLASLLTFSLIMLGIIALIVPGIIIACRLAFVGYLVMDKKLDPIMAVEESWKMTKGHGWTVFFMGIVSFFIYIAGFCLLIVGIFPASIWVGSSFASLYETIRTERAV
jgi:hypothetical protein